MKQFQTFAGSTRDGVPVGLIAYQPDLSADLSAVTIDSATEVITATSGKRVRLVTLDFSVSAAGSVVFKQGSEVLYRTPVLAANERYTVEVLGKRGALATAAGNVTAQLSVAGAITGTLGYNEQ